MKRSIVLSILAALVIVMTAGAEAKSQKTVMPKKPREKPKIEVVFVLDTTGSMSGLIHAAKEKIWAIANTMATARPAPEIRMGLVGYRDRSDVYVTKRTQLTEDLDKVYRDLMAYSANGGGDTPESVNQALNEAVGAFNWSRDEKTYRVIFLVGDAPPHMNYQNDVKYAESCKTAAKNGIIINTIQCGSLSGTEEIWREIARRAEGVAFRVEQSGGVMLSSTPFDSEMAEMSKKLDSTRIYYGSRSDIATAEAREMDADEIYARSTVAAQAQRAAFNAKASGSRNFAGKQELLTDIADGRKSIKDIRKDELPKEMQSLPTAELEREIAKKQKTREELRRKIGKLDEKRKQYLKKLADKKGLKGKASFDKAVYQCIRDQAGRKGIVYSEDMVY